MAVNVALRQKVPVVRPLEYGRKIHPAKTPLPCLAYDQPAKWEGYCAGSTTNCSERDKMQMCRKGRRHVMRVWKNILLRTSWWKYAGWGCSRLRTSAEGVSRLPEENADSEHRPQFSPAVSQIACSQDDFGGGGAPIAMSWSWECDSQSNHLFYMLYKSCL